MVVCHSSTSSTRLSLPNSPRSTSTSPTPSCARRGVGLALALAEGDPGTRELLEHLVVGEEEHLDWIETQQGIIRDIGIERYLQSQMHG